MKRLLTWAGIVALIVGVVGIGAERADIYVERGTGYTLLYSQGSYIVGFGNAAPAIQGAFGTTGHAIPDNALFYRTDLGTFYTATAGSFVASSFAGQTLTSTTLAAPAITGVATFASDPVTAADVGTEAVADMTVTENGDGAVHKTTFTFAAHSVTMTDAAAAGNHGSVPIYTFPAGFIKVYGSLCNLTTLAGAGGITDTAALVASVGSVQLATDNATLTGTEADIIASFAGTLAAGAGVFTKDGALVAALYDGHTTAEAIFLNIAVPDAGSSGNDTLVLSGTCTIVWSNVGDF